MHLNHHLLGLLLLHGLLAAVLGASLVRLGHATSWSRILVELRLAWGWLTLRCVVCALLHILFYYL